MGLLLKLQNGDTTLKSLKFGNDSSKLGDGSQPFIQKDINDNPKSVSTPDSILRGGIDAVDRAKDDVERLSKFFQTTEGANFILKQNLLSRTNVLVNAGGDDKKKFKFINGNGGIYSPISTISQAGVGFIGTHLNKQGLDPTGLIPFISQYQYINDINVSQTRLETLYEKIQNKSYSEDYILKYSGGPNSVLGIGNTKVKFSTNIEGNPLRTGDNQITSSYPTTVSEKTSFQTESQISSYLPSGSSYKIGTDNNVKHIVAFNNDGKTYIDPNLTPLSEKALGKKELYRSVKETPSKDENGKYVIYEDKSIVTPSYLQRQSRTSDNVNKIKPDFRKASRESRGFINDPSSSYDYLTTSSSYDTGSLDSYYYSSGGKRESNQLNDEQDYIPFSITINDDRPLRFRAYLDDISDSYQAGWNPQSYMGRAEKFYKYNSFDRDISFGFTIVADNELNLNIMYAQLNVLAASLAPTYSGWGYMSGNIHKLTIGDYIINQPGILTSLTYSITTESPWGIENNKKPFYIKVTGVKFIPIHEFRPEYKSDSNKFEPIYQPGSSVIVS
jgi:hypothetical protein